MRSVVAKGPQNPPPKGAEKMDLTVTNSATGKSYGEILWIGKEVLIHQNDLQEAKVVTNTPAMSNVPGKPVIEITFTPEGRKRFAEVTRQNIDKRLAIIVEGRIVSAPVIRSEISGGKGIISGNFTHSEAVELSNKINQALKK